MSLLERDDAPRDTKALPTVTHIGWAQFARAAMTNARGGQSGFRNFMVPWLLSPEHMYVTNGFDALRAYVADNPHAWTDESGSPIAFPAKPKQSDAEQRAAVREKAACDLFVKKIMHTGFKLCMRWFYPKHVPEFAKYKDEDRVHFKWLQYDVDLNLLVSNMDNVQERDAVREYFTHNRYSMKVITGEDHLPPHVGAAFPRFFPWKDPFREMYLHYGHASKAPERPSAQTPAPLGETSSRKRRRGGDAAEPADAPSPKPSTEVAPSSPGGIDGFVMPALVVQRSDSEVFGREVGPPFIQVVGAANGPPLVHAYTVTYAPARVLPSPAVPRPTAPKATQTPLSAGESGIEGARRWAEKFRGGRKPRFADTP